MALAVAGPYSEGYIFPCYIKPIVADSLVLLHLTWLGFRRQTEAAFPTAATVPAPGFSRGLREMTEQKGD